MVYRPIRRKRSVGLGVAATIVAGFALVALTAAYLATTPAHSPAASRKPEAPPSRPRLTMQEIAAREAEERKPTYENFLRIQPGMTLEEVTAILGEGFEIVSKGGFSDYRAAHLRWDGAKGNCDVVFLNGRVTVTSQQGLKQ